MTSDRGTLPAAEYVHEMQYCFNGITDLPPSPGDKIERFKSGLNPALKRLVVTAPFGMGRDGKRLDPNQLMSYTVTQAQGLPNGGALAASTAPASGQKRSHDGAANGNDTGHGKGKKQKKNRGGKGAASYSGGDKGKSAFHPGAERPWLNNHRAKTRLALVTSRIRSSTFATSVLLLLCYHCCLPGHSSLTCEKKKNGVPVAPMPAAFMAKKAAKE